MKGGRPLPPPTPPGDRGPRSPVVIASVGTLSGPVGEVFEPVVLALQAWARHVNGRGGLNGHRVDVVVYDDGGDPARHRAQVQEATERRGVIAFVANAEGLSGGTSVEYLEKKRVPVIGGEGGEGWAYRSPMYFPQASSGDHFLAGAIHSAAQQAVPKGKVRLATLACAEAQFCTDADRIWSGAAARLGFGQVFRGRASMTQPDFSAECLAMRNAGAEVVLVGLDSNSVGRLALSCARQGYRPTYATTGAILAERMKDDVNLDGLLGASNVFPFFQSGTPATDEYQQVMRGVGGRIPPGISAATGWAAAKLFERASVDLPEPPTSDALLAGLWRIKGDTLAGLTYPLTFVENQPPAGRTCWFNITVRDRAWVSPDRFTVHCDR